MTLCLERNLFSEVASREGEEEAGQHLLAISNSLGRSEACDHITAHLKCWGRDFGSNVSGQNIYLLE
jgi:hypothetical protein